MTTHADSDDDRGLLPPLDDAAGPALPLDEGERALAVERALLAAAPVRRTGLWRRRSLSVLLAATFTVSGLAWALTASWRRPLTPASPVADPVASGRLAPRALAPVAEPSASALVANDAVALPVPSAAAGPARSATVADQLKLANQLRGQARWAEAERAYAQLATAYAGTTQGSVAALAAASLRLEHLGDAKGALKLYRAAQRSGRLAAEADLGVANAYRALGDRGAEMAALRELLAKYPQALFRERVARRLSALETGAP